jgi:hypothetical protein
LTKVLSLKSQLKREQFFLIKDILRFKHYTRPLYKWARQRKQTRLKIAKGDTYPALLGILRFAMTTLFLARVANRRWPDMPSSWPAAPYLANQMRPAASRLPSTSPRCLLPVGVALQRPQPDRHDSNSRPFHRLCCHSTNPSKWQKEWTYRNASYYLLLIFPQALRVGRLLDAGEGRLLVAERHGAAASSPHPSPAGEGHRRG